MLCVKRPAKAVITQIKSISIQNTLPAPLLCRLCASFDHGEIEISNNQVENAIRPIVVGRKNWLFCDTQAGAYASATIFTLLETTKANGLNPEAYLNHLLTVLPGRFAADPQAAVDDLMPWYEKIRVAFGGSSVEH